MISKLCPPLGKSNEAENRDRCSSQEVGEDSKLARSFERIRSIVRRRRLAKKEKKYPKLEQIVNDVMAQHMAEKKRIRSSNKHYLTVEFPQKSLYRHSYQVGSKGFIHGTTDKRCPYSVILSRNL